MIPMPNDDPPSKTDLDPLRALIIERARELRLTLADLSRMAHKNDAYVHQFIYRRSPRRLPEDVRPILSEALGIPEDVLRGTAPVTPIESARLRLVPVAASSAAPAPAAAPPTASTPNTIRDVPVHTDSDEEIDPAKAREWTHRPSILPEGETFALWITSSRAGGRLRPGDLAFVRLNQPPRIGDTVVVIEDKKIIAIGDLASLDETTATIATGHRQPKKVQRGTTRILKVACAAFA